jgi:hypothetical protein
VFADDLDEPPPLPGEARVVQSSRPQAATPSRSP